MCKKRGRHDEDTEPIDNGEEQFAHKFFNLMKNTQNMLCRCLFHKLIWISTTLASL
jgi:hypothetical protein